MITDPLFYAVAAIAVLLTGMSKAGFGGGLGFLSTLSIAMVIPPAQAAAIMLPILCFMDPMGAWAYRRSWDGPSVLILLPGAIFGIVLGTFTFGWLSEQALRLVLGVISVAFTAEHMLKGVRPAKPGIMQSKPIAFVLGAISGYTSFLIHAGLPPIAMYLLPKQMTKFLYVGTIAILFFAINYAKIPGYAFLGLLSGDNLLTSLILAPLAPVGVWIGLRVVRLIPQDIFYRIVYTLIFVMGLKLIWDGVRPWLS